MTAHQIAMTAIQKSVPICLKAAPTCTTEMMPYRQQIALPR
jgi:hypothetical protein